MYQAFLIVSDRKYTPIDQISRYVKLFAEVVQWGRYGTYDPMLADQG